ncbi:MAG: hypothetical protein QOF07_2807, partial [Bradyrhizobium sp.]|nr:hypothetical protein [Bradyrhizobium sp.]
MNTSLSFLLSVFLLGVPEREDTVFMTVPGDLFRALRAPDPEPSRRLGQATSCSIPSPERLRPNLRQRQAGVPYGV